MDLCFWSSCNKYFSVKIYMNICVSVAECIDIQCKSKVAVIMAQLFSTNAFSTNAFSADAFSLNVLSNFTAIFFHTLIKENNNLQNDVGFLCRNKPIV